jgi:hypothetical protein
MKKLSPKPQPWFTPTISTHQILLGILFIYLFIFIIFIFFPNIKMTMGNG